MTLSIRIARSDAHVVSFDETKLSDEVRAFVFSYGIRQLLNDAGSAMKSPDEKLAAAQKKLDTLLAGEIRTTRSSNGVTLTPVEAEAQSMAWEQIKTRLKAKQVKASDVSPEDKAKYIAGYLVKFPEVMKEAQKRIDAKAKLSGSFDLDDLLG